MHPSSFPPHAYTQWGQVQLRVCGNMARPRVARGWRGTVLGARELLVPAPCGGKEDTAAKIRARVTGRASCAASEAGRRNNKSQTSQPSTAFCSTFRRPCFGAAPPPQVHQQARRGGGVLAACIRTEQHATLDYGSEQKIQQTDDRGGRGGANAFVFAVFFSCEGLAKKPFFFVLFFISFC